MISISLFIWLVITGGLILCSIEDIKRRRGMTPKQRRLEDEETQKDADF